MLVVVASLVVLTAACGGGRAATAPTSPLPSTSASLQSAGASESPGSPAPIDCSTVLSVIWPDDGQQPKAPAWHGPTCTAATDVVLTWTYAGSGAAPEVTDAAFVALRTTFRNGGWIISEPSSTTNDGTTEASSAMTASNGRKARVIYTSGSSTPATLQVVVSL